MLTLLEQTQVLILNCAIAVTISVQDDPRQLEIAYSVDNRGEMPILLFNRMTNPAAPETPPNPDHLVVWPYDGTLALEKAALDPPVGMLVESLYIPEATLLRPGAHFAETVRLSLPLDLWHPYHDREEVEDAVLDDLRSGAFRLGLLTTYPEYLTAVEVNRVGDIETVRVEALDPSAQSFARVLFPLSGLSVAKPLSGR